MATYIFVVLGVFSLLHIFFGLVYDKEIRAEVAKENIHYAIAVLRIAKNRGGWRYLYFVSYCLMIASALVLVNVMFFGNWSE